MARKIYYGAGGKARKVKKIYYVAGGRARKVRRGYIGVGGKARPFWTGGELAYYGNSEDGAVEGLVPQGISARAATPAGDYALFSIFPQKTANAYHKYLQRVSVSVTVSYAPYLKYAASVGGHALFAGGLGSDGNYGIAGVVAISSQLVVKSPSSLSEGRDLLGAASTKSYAIFAGGQPYANNNGFGAPTTKVDAYSSGLTRTTAQALEKAKDSLQGESFFGGGYALFAWGGYANSSSNQGSYNTMDAYNNSLVRTNPEPLDDKYSSITHACTEEHALFRVSSTVINAYSKDLTKIRVSNTPNVTGMKGLRLGEYALFAGDNRKNAFGYTKDLTCVEIPVPAPHASGIAAATGDYGLVSDSKGKVSVYTA